jgi:hypothetical protein
MELKNPSAQEVALIFGCTPEQVRAQYLRNAKQLAEMAERAHVTGRKFNGFTEAELRQHAVASRARAQ